MKKLLVSLLLIGSAVAQAENLTLVRKQSLNGHTGYHHAVVDNSGKTIAQFKVFKKDNVSEVQADDNGDKQIRAQSWCLVTQQIISEAGKNSSSHVRKVVDAREPDAQDQERFYKQLGARVESQSSTKKSFIVDLPSLQKKYNAVCSNS